MSFWTLYWGLTLDPFSEEPLYYNHENFEKLLVRYAPIQEVDEILENLYKERKRLMRKRHYIIGLRGMGKTTVLNYIFRKILEKPNERVMSIYINNVHVKDPTDVIDPAHDPEKLRLNFCLRTIEALFNTVLHVMKETVSEYQNFEKIRAKYFDRKGEKLIDQATAESLLKEYLNKLKKDFDVFVLLYDELDKIDEYDTVLRFLRSSQGLLETLSEYGCIIFLCGVPDFSKMLRTSEYYGVSGHEIWINMWSADDAKSLIQSRLDYAMFSGTFPFRDKVIEAICNRAECRPRLIQGQARDSLIWAAYNRRKIIDEKFLEELVWDEASTLKFKAEIKSSKDFQEAISILRKVYDPDRDDPAAYFLLTKIFENVRLRPTDLNKRYGIDMEDSQFKRLIHLLKDFEAVFERQVNSRNYYVLNNKLERVLSYVKKTLGKSIEYLPRAIKSDGAEVSEAKAVFSIRNEITKIFVMNPQRRYRKSELVNEVLGNPDSKRRAQTYYKVGADRQIRSKTSSALGSVLHNMIKQGTVLEVVKGNRVSYQFSEAVEEINWAANLRLDEDVLQNFQSAVRTFKQRDIGGSVSLLRLAVENTLRHLAEACNIDLPERPKLNTLGPINDKLCKAKIYDEGLRLMIQAFTMEVNPIVHGKIVIDDTERAKNLFDRAEMIIKRAYKIKKQYKKTSP